MYGKLFLCSASLFDYYTMYVCVIYAMITVSNCGWKPGMTTKKGLAYHKIQMVLLS